MRQREATNKSSSLASEHSTKSTRQKNNKEEKESLNFIRTCVGLLFNFKVWFTSDFGCFFTDRDRQGMRITVFEPQSDPSLHGPERVSKHLLEHHGH